MSAGWAVGGHNLWTRHNQIWYDAPVPPRLHTCQPWTVAVDAGHLVQRCACGSIKVDNWMWANRNSTRRAVRAEARRRAGRP